MQPRRTQRPFACALAAACAIAASACGVFSSETSRHPTPASGVAQGTGRVHIEPARADGRYLVTFVGDEFAPPSSIVEGATTYVMWIRPPGGSAENVGPLPVDEAGNGRIVIDTPHESFTLLITAEPHAGVLEPLGRAVFTIAASTE